MPGHRSRNSAIVNPKLDSASVRRPLTQRPRQRHIVLDGQRFRAAAFVDAKRGQLCGAQRFEAGRGDGKTVELVRLGGPGGLGSLLTLPRWAR